MLAYGDDCRHLSHSVSTIVSTVGVTRSAAAALLTRCPSLTPESAP